MSSHDEHTDLKATEQDSTVSSNRKTVKLSSGYDLPIFAYGTTWRYGINAYWGGYQHSIWDNNLNSNQRKQQDELEACIVTAIKLGYTCIDTAEGYSTEQIIGSKERTIAKCEQSVQNSLKLLNTDYIDLYLIHSPHTTNGGMDVIKIYQFLLNTYKSKGIIRSIGVSNFNVQHIQCLRAHGLELPSVNQIAFSCFFNPQKLVKFCTQNNIVVQGYSPLCKASEIVTTNKILLKIAKKYNKSWSDICLKYCFQKQIAIVCQSKNSHRMQQNINSYLDETFVILDEDMNELDRLNDIKLRLSWGHNNPLDIKWYQPKQ
eukprot:297181_1